MATYNSAKQTRPRDLDLTTPPMTRNASVSSDKASTISRRGGPMSPPAGIRPEAAYIAVSAASQIITNDHENHSQIWYDEDGIEPSGETVRVSPGSLKKVNGFLDYLLHRFLAVARSTSLAALKPAVNEVLKRKLAQEAVSGADQELMEYMGGANEELVAYYNGQDAGGDWDLELAWKRTRLRCMVYSSLGDMEEEDEKMFADQESLDSPAGINGDFTDNPGIVSPAVAIFLTSILEFIGEQALIVAGQAAYNRIRQERSYGKSIVADTSSRDSTISTSTFNEIAERVTVEEFDTEKVATNVSLGRLWRTWKKCVRSPNNSYSRPISQDSSFHQYRRPSISNSSRCSSVNGHGEDPGVAHQRGIVQPELRDVPEEELPLTIPLPMAENDVEQIEVPGLAPTYESDADSTQTEVPGPVRRSQSFSSPRPPFDSASVLDTSIRQYSAKLVSSGHTSRLRSRSVPSPERRPLVIADVTAESADQEDFVTPFERANPLEAAGERDESPSQTGEHEIREEQSVVEPDQNKETNGVPTSSSKEVKIEKEKESKETPKQQMSTKEKIVAGVVAGSAAIGTAITAASISSTKRTTESQSETLTSETKVPTQRASKAELEKLADADDAEEAQIMETTRVSLEGKRAPEIVQTRSRAASISPPNKVPIDQKESLPKVQAFRRSDQGEHDPTEIGLAKTSNVSVPAVIPPSSPITSSEQPSPDSKVLGSSQHEHSRGMPSTEHEHDKDDGEHVVKAKPQFILAAPPASRAAKGLSEKPSSDTQNNLLSSDSLAPASRTPGAEIGVPPLTPLREMMEAAHDTSDEASSIAPSHGTSRSDHSVSSLGHAPGHHANEQSISSNYSHAKQASTSSSKYSDHKVPQTVAYPPPDRAAVQRVFTPTVTTFDAAGVRPRRSDSLTKSSQRPIHTSGSGTSQVSHKLKGLIGNLHDTSDKPLPPLRRSEDDSEKNVESFDKLIQSGETLQYTLTPQTVRETEPKQPATTAALKPPGTQPANSQPDATEHKAFRGETAEVAEVVRSAAPTTIGPSSTTENRQLPSFSRPTPVPNGLRSNPPTASASTSELASPKPRAYIPKTIPIPPSKRTKPQRPGAPQAREARPTGGSTRDIIEFLRVTGPDGQIMPAARAQVTRSPSSVTNNSRMGSSVSGASAQWNGLSSPSNFNREIQSSWGGPTVSIAGQRPRLEAREASVPFGESSSDLADFIRQGPPTSSSPVEGRRQPPMLQNSASRMSSSITPIQNRPSDQDMPMPQRTQRRIRDPYAIDLDDEDEYHLYEGGQSHVKEESLADFLMSVAPPKFSQPQSLQHSAAAVRLLNNVQKSGLDRANSTNSNSSSVRASNGNSKAPNGSSDAAGGYAPKISLSKESADPMFSASGSLGMGDFTQKSGAYSSTTNAGTSSRRLNPGIQSRMSAQNDDGNLREMADFLRSSGPPASSSTYVPPVKEGGSISKLFRKKKLSAS